MRYRYMSAVVFCFMYVCFRVCVSYSWVALVTQANWNDYKHQWQHQFGLANQFIHMKPQLRILPENHLKQRGWRLNQRWDMQNNSFFHILHAYMLIQLSNVLTMLANSTSYQQNNPALRSRGQGPNQLQLRGDRLCQWWVRPWCHIETCYA